MNNTQKKKIAIIGSGISGISASYFLSSKYEVQLYEKNNYLGGHTRTINISTDNNLPIDTGFIVYNNKNYPDLIKFFDLLQQKNLSKRLSIIKLNAVSYMLVRILNLVTKEEEIYKLLKNMKSYITLKV